MKSTMVSFLILIFAASAWAGTLIYDFEDESQLEDWFEVPTLDGTPYTARWSVENGELMGFSNDPSIHAGQGFGTGDDTWMDYTFECQLKLKQAFPEGGVFVVVVVHFHLAPGIRWHHRPPGENDGTTHWGVWSGIIYNGSWNLIEWGSAVESAFTAGESIDMVLEENRWYTVRIENESNHYMMFLDGKMVLEDDAGSPEHTYGVPGFGLMNCQAYFDNVVITGDSIPDTTLSSVSSRSKLTTTWGCIRE